MSEFYEKVLGKKADWQAGNWSGYQVGSTHLTIGEHSEVKGGAKEPQRILFNFETDDVKGEFERIKGLGTKVIKEPYAPDEAPEMWIATFADPDGNYFQLMSPMGDIK
ncbi:MAG: hypothetical protein US19_C0048G0003 [Candidatus Daviesbacteria bacterium GW2011_GWB1_36_5]|nr:MAG: hypothetical protein US19_C0048G0003 [Candidatus Daviesbacteria bacterium GW2011_GWB1_36_5]